jgi:hypothetical protein
VSSHAVSIYFCRKNSGVYKALNAIEISLGPVVIISGLPLYALEVPVTQIFYCHKPICGVSISLISIPGGCASPIVYNFSINITSENGFSLHFFFFRL